MRGGKEKNPFSEQESNSDLFVIGRNGSFQTKPQKGGKMSQINKKSYYLTKKELNAIHSPDNDFV